MNPSGLRERDIRLKARGDLDGDDDEDESDDLLRRADVFK